MLSDKLTAVPLLAYTRFRFLWGALTAESGADEPTYGTGTTEADVGADSTVRHATVVWSRTGEDQVMSHFTFVNITDGAFDDTWTDADYEAVEALILAWWAYLKYMYPSTTKLDKIAWHRRGPSVVPPEAAVRVLEVDVAGTSAANQNLPAQVAMTITLRTALRRRWGRLYLPAPAKDYNSDGRIGTTQVTDMADATDTLISDAADADFKLVVYSPTIRAAYTVESINVDNVFDVMRSRRVAASTVNVSRPA